MRPIDLDKIEFIKADGNEEFNHGVDCCINKLLKAPTLKVIKAEVLDKIRAEIDEQYKWLIDTRHTIYDIDIAFDSIFWFIDKYKAESEDKE